MLKKFILIIPFLLLAGCDFFGPESKLKDLVDDKYKVIEKIGESDEAIFFEVQNKEGGTRAAKFWPKDKEHQHLRGTTPFKNAVRVHQLLNDLPTVNRLYEAIGDQVMILEHVKGQELFKLLAKEVSEEKIISITEQLLTALEAIAQKNIIPVDVNAKNILVVDDDPLVKLVDIGAYIVVDDVIEHNKAFEQNDFNLFNQDALKKMLVDVKKFKTGDHYIIDEQKYALIPPLTLYATLTERMNVLSRLLTKFAYIKAERGTQLIKIPVEESTDLFGDDPHFVARPWTEEIEERARNILHMASLENDTPHYTAENFREDVGETFTISNLIYDKTRLCLEHIQDCLKP